MLQIFKRPQIYLWYIVLFLLGLSVCTSKSLYAIFTVIVILWTFLDKSKFQIWSKNLWIVLIAGLFPLAILFSLFSIGGVTSALFIIKSWYWPLVACPVAIVASDRKSISPILGGLFLGLVIASLHSYFNAFEFVSSNRNVAFMSDAFRVTSFWDISRWGFFSGLIILFLLQLLAISKRYERVTYGLLFTITLIPFLLTNTRAPLLALTALSILLILSDRSVRKYGLFLIAFLLIFAGTIPKYQERFLSIFQVHLAEEKLVSTNQSNLARLNMWKVATDFYLEQPFFGTGYENSEMPLRNFLQQKGSAYIKNYVSQDFSYSDQHSSYVTTLVQFGLIFTVISFLLYAVIFTKTFIYFWKTKDFISRFSLMGLSYCIIIFFFYSALSSYEASVFFVLLSLAALCYSSEPIPVPADIP